MRVHNTTVWQMQDDPTSYVLLSDDFFEYNGQVAEAKKGRKGVEAAAKAQAELAKQAAADAAAARQRQAMEQARIEPVLRQYESVGLGQLSPLAASNLGASTENLNRFWTGVQGTGYRQLGAQGFGRAPSGAESFLRANVARNQAEDTMRAYREALNETESGRRLALGVRTGEEQFYDPSSRLANAGGLWGQSGQSYQRLGQMGNLFTDILGGVGTLASAFVPGGPLLKLGMGALGTLGRRRPEIPDSTMNWAYNWPSPVRSTIPTGA